MIAEDVAIGMAEKAEQERLRANAIARGNINLQREANEAQFRSVHAQHEAVEAKREANKSKFGFWLLASLIGATLLFGSLWAANRNDDTDTAASASQPPVVTRTVVGSPAPSASRAVVREYVPVPVPVQPAPAPVVQTPPAQGYIERTAPQPAPSLAAPAPAPSVAAPATQPESPDQPLSGYIER